MSENLLYDTLASILKRLDSMEMELKSLRRESESTKTFSPIPESETFEKIAERVVVMARNSWETFRKPITSRMITQRFGQMIKRLGSTGSDFIYELENHGIIKIITSHYGSTFVFLPEHYEQLSNDDLNDLQYQGMSSKRQKQLSKVGGPSAKELDDAGKSAVEYFKSRGLLGDSNSSNEGDTP